MKLKYKLVITILLITCLIISSNSFCYADKQEFLASPGATSLTEPLDFDKNLTNPLLSYYQKQEERIEVVKKLLVQSGIIQNIKDNHNNNVAQFLSNLYFPPIIDKDRFAVILSEFKAHALNLSELPAFVKQRVIAYISNNKDKILIKSHYKNYMEKEINVYLDIVSRLIPNGRRKELIHEKMLANKIGLNVDEKIQYEFATRIGRLYFEPLILTVQFERYLEQFRQTKKKVRKLPQFIREKILDYIVDQEIDISNKMHESMLFQEMFINYMMKIVTISKMEIPRILNILNYLQSMRSTNHNRQLFSIKIKEIEKIQEDFLRYNALKARGFIQRNKEKLKIKGLRITEFSYAFEVRRRLHKVGIKSDVFYKRIYEENTDYHVWVVTRDGVIIDTHSPFIDGIRIMRFSKDKNGTYLGNNISNDTAINRINEMSLWFKLTPKLAEQEKIILGNNPDLAMDNFEKIKSNKHLVNVTQAINKFLKRGVRGVGEVLIQIVRPDGSFNEEYLGEFVEAYEVEQHVRYARITQLSKKTAGVNKIIINEVDYILEVDKEKYADKKTGTVELENGMYLGESKTFDQTKDLKTEISIAWKDKKEKYKESRQIIQIEERKNIQGIILTIGGACVPAYGITKFTFWPNKKLNNELNIVFIPDTVLYPYQPRAGIIKKSIKPEELFSM